MRAVRAARPKRPRPFALRPVCTNVSEGRPKAPFLRRVSGRKPVVLPDEVHLGSATPSLLLPTAYLPTCQLPSAPRILPSAFNLLNSDS